MARPVSPVYVAFDERGEFVDRPGYEAVLTGFTGREPPTDVFVFSHGWKNSFSDASQTYGAVIGQMTSVADSVSGTRPSPFRPLPLGVIWPSKAWDELGGAAGEGATEAVADTGWMAEAVYEALSPARASPAGFRRDVLRMQQLLLKDRLEAQERDEFRAMLRLHAEPAILAEEESVFEADAPAEGLEGITGGDFSARDVFRTFTYWQMKKRAGVVGQAGVRAAIAAVQERFHAARVHLVGHSFGCKVVLAAVAGPGTPLTRPVQTVVLLQGAVSHEALASRVSGTELPGGYQAALDPRRVSGPIVATFSRLDKACCDCYPLGSRLAGHVGELEGLFDRYRALGAVGAFGVAAAMHHAVAMKDVGEAYSFEGCGVWSVNGGEPPGEFITGHSEICTPQVAWLIWAAVRRR